MNAIRCLLVLLLPTFHTTALSPAPQNATPTNNQPTAPSGKTPAQLAALDALNAGTEQFRNGQYEKAIDAFKDAKRFDPELVNARLYLATAYASEYIPGDPSDQNKGKVNLPSLNLEMSWRWTQRISLPWMLLVRLNFRWLARHSIVNYSWNRKAIFKNISR